MATGRGLGIVTDGLVFYYDTGNSIDSYKGEPTTNLLNNTIVAAGNGASLEEDSFGTYIQLPDITSGYSRFQLPNISVSSNDVYTWSFELYTTETFSSGFSWDTNEYSDQYPNSNDLSRVTYNASTPSTISAGVWTPFRLTVTMKDGLTGAYTYDFFRFFFPQFQNKKVYYRNMQFEFKNHKTQYAGQGGSRSATQGLLDISGQGTSIDLSNVSFDSNAQMTFDGTDDYVEITGFYVPTGSRSVELIVKTSATDNSNPQDHIFANSDQPGNGTDDAGIAIIYRNNNFYGYIWEWNNNLSPRKNFTFVTSPSTDKFYHLVLTHDGVTARAYTNGELVSSQGCVGSRFPSNDTTLGRYSPGYSNGYQGDLPLVKVYSKALTAAEVKRNYDALKTRFGLT